MVQVLEGVYAIDGCLYFIGFLFQQFLYERSQLVVVVDD
jgi:hypothetical protein